MNPTNGKGSKRRPEDKSKIDANWPWPDPRLTQRGKHDIHDTRRTPSTETAYSAADSGLPSKGKSDQGD